MEGSLVGLEALVPPGRYQAGFTGYRTMIMFGKKPKLELRFKIADGEHLGKDLCAYYGARRLMGEKGASGKFQVGPKSDFARLFFRLFPSRANRLDRLPMSLFEGVLFEVDVRTVERGSKQEKIPQELRYSVINQIVRPLNR